MNCVRLDENLDAAVFATDPYIHCWDGPCEGSRLGELLGHWHPQGFVITISDGAFNLPYVTGSGQVGRAVYRLGFLEMSRKGCSRDSIIVLKWIPPDYKGLNF